MRNSMQNLDLCWKSGVKPTDALPVAYFFQERPGAHPEQPAIARIAMITHCLCCFAAVR
jgi:hypothetical protein